MSRTMKQAGGPAKKAAKRPGASSTTPRTAQPAVLAASPMPALRPELDINEQEWQRMLSRIVETRELR